MLAQLRIKSTLDSPEGLPDRTFHDNEASLCSSETSIEGFCDLIIAKYTVGFNSVSYFR